MESLSRPFRRKKLHSFSDYDGVFAGGAPGVSRFDDYNDIFGGSRSSIPVLDLSQLDGAVDVVGSRGKAVDYSNIFGGEMGDDVVDSYEEVFSQRTPAKAASRSNGSASPGCQKEEEKLRGTPNRSVEGMKQYNTFYNRTSQGSKDGENGTTHVAHFRAVPGFTCFIDGNIQKTEGDEFRTLPRDKMRLTPKFSVELDTKQATDGTEKLESQSSWDKLHSPDRNVDANGGNFKKQPFKLSSPTRVPASTTSETKRSRELYFNIPKSGSSKTGPDDCAPSFSDDELDADSAAAVSAAALRKAVQEAEAIIRLAKEIMERRKNGLHKFPKPRSKGSLEMKKKNVEKASVQVIRTEKVAPNLKQIEEVRISNEGVRETNDAKSNSYDDGQAHIVKLESKKARRSGKLSPNIIQSVENCVPQNICGKGNEGRLETSVDLKTPGEIPGMLKTDDHKTATLELEHPKGSNFRLFVNNLFGKVNENKLKTCADSKALEQFPDLVTTENQRKEALEMGDTNGCNITSPVHNIYGKGNEDMLEPSADLVKTENPRTTNLELEHTNGNNVMPSVHRLCREENEDKMEIFVDSKVLGRFPGLVKTDNQRNITLQLGPTNDSNIMTSVHSFSENENEEKLEIFSDSKELPELVKPDKQKTEDFKALGKFPELVKTDDQKTEILDEEQKIGSNISPPVQNVLRKENEEKFEPSDDARAPEQSPELVKTDNQRTATLELGHKYGSEIVPPVERTNDCGEMEKQTDERTFELLERHSKEVHRKRKQWKDFEGIPSEIKIAEDGGQSSRSTTAGEVHEQEERNSEPLEGNTKEIFRKRKQWKDVEVKPYDIKIVGDGEKCIHGQERRDKATDVPHNKVVEDKPTTSCSEEPYEKEVVNSQEREKIEGFEPLNVNTNHGEESDEAQKWLENEKIKECSKEPEIANSSMDVHEEKESVILMCKQDIIEKKFQESSKWRDHEVTFEVESNERGQNDDNRTTDAWKEDGSQHSGDCQVAHKYEEDDNHISFEGSETMSDASQSSIDFKEDFSFDEEEVGEASEIFQSCEFNVFEIGFRSERTYVQGQTQTSMTNQAVEDVTITEATESLLFNGIPENAVSSDDDSGTKQTYFDGINSELANNKSAGIEVSDQMQEETNVFDLKIEMARRIEASQLPIIFKGEEITKGLYEQEWFTMRNRKEGQPPYISKKEEKTRGIDEVEEKTAKENREKEVRAEKEQLERNDDLSKREREREQNRVVVERAIREARERAFAEARERAERAAVEKATAEARERVMAEARQKFEKTNTATKSSTEKASLQAKLRSERAAVERAHAEARERALEKALSQKSIFPSSKLDGNNGESVERRNARLEKTQRTMERAAKALAEKNMRDLRAQREQAERHRLAETLDAEIKRWSSGKTGNLRALLSTLQYILGPDSGWQSVSLTEIVTTNAVKKAYRKATLHVHPDKLQQRGATIQQKYICEKVFDLLKAAWNRFNSEER